MILLRLSQEQDDAPIELEALSSGPVGSCLKTFLEGLMHIKYVEAQSPLGDVVWKFGEGYQSSGVVIGNCPWLKITRSVAKSPRVAE
ncbi:hypothetical protein TNCV_2823591 [Trichonephila clavipes]|nr:hypothetical protein TNCV_2823591 [Trichonephila clavipes]